MTRREFTERLIGVGGLGAGLLRDSARAAAGVLNIVRETRVLGATTVPGLSQALASLAAGDHPFGVVLTFHAANRGHRRAIVHGERALSWAELLVAVNQASHTLEAAGVKPGDRVLLMMGNCPEWLIFGAAAGNVGAGLIPIATGLKGAGLAYVIDHARPRAILTDAARFPAVAEATAGRPELRSRTLVRGAAGLDLDGALDLDAALAEAPRGPFPPPPGRALFPSVTLYTSGTTGRPKGVERTDTSLALRAVPTVEGLVRAFGFTTDDVTWFPSPLYHAAPLLFAASHLAAGGTVVLGEETQPAAIIEALQRHHVTNALLVPTLLSRLAHHEPAPQPGDFPHLRALFSTADRLPIAVAEAIRDRFGDVVHDFYGSTETGIVTLATPQDLRAHPGTVGRALPGAEIHLLDEDGEEVAPGEAGILYARTGLAMAGYRGDPDATQQASRRGLFTVGDVARRDAGGYYWIVGRSSHLLISGGVNVYPAEVEEALLRHPQVAQVAVVGLPDDEWGEVVTAVIVAKGPLDAESLDTFAAAQLTGPQRPRRWFFWDELPVSPQGKVQKREILTRLKEASPPPPAPRKRRAKKATPAIQARFPKDG